jgi:hypothetical protein
MQFFALAMKQTWLLALMWIKSKGVPKCCKIIEWKMGILIQEGY